MSRTVLNYCFFFFWLACCVGCNTEAKQRIELTNNSSNETLRDLAVRQNGRLQPFGSLEPNSGMVKDVALGDSAQLAISWVDQNGKSQSRSLTIPPIGTADAKTLMIDRHENATFTVSWRDESTSGMVQ